MKKRELCRPEELILQPKGCKSNASLEPYPPKSFHMFSAQKPVLCGFEHAESKLPGSSQPTQVSPVNKHCFKKHALYKTALRMCLPT